MQSGPKGVDISGLSADIERVRITAVLQSPWHPFQIPNVLRVHDLHVWQLLGDKPIASIHILCKKPSKFMKTARQIKAVFHGRFPAISCSNQFAYSLWFLELDIHTVTIQPEFLASKDEAVRVCLPKLKPTKLIPFPSLGNREAVSLTLCRRLRKYGSPCLGLYTTRTLGGNVCV